MYRKFSELFILITFTSDTETTE